LILLDTSGLLAAFFPDQNRHAECLRALRDAEPPRLMSPLVLAELDYMIVKYAGVEAEVQFLAEVVTGVYEVSSVTTQHIINAQEVIARHRDLRIGLADAMTVVLAQHYNCRDVLTLDERHFRVLRFSARTPFRLLPSDSSPSARTTRARARSLRP